MLDLWYFFFILFKYENECYTFLILFYEVAFRFYKTEQINSPLWHIYNEVLTGGNSSSANREKDKTGKFIPTIIIIIKINLCILNINYIKNVIITSENRRF